MNTIKPSLLLSSIIFANAYACDNFNFTLHNLTGTNCKLTYKMSSVIESTPAPQTLAKGQSFTANLKNKFNTNTSLWLDYSCENGYVYEVTIETGNMPIPQKWCTFGVDINLEK